MLLQKIKLTIRLLRRKLSDFLSGDKKRFATFSSTIKKDSFTLLLSQDIKPTSFYENKIINITLASDKIKQITILPNQIFSFWQIIGEPSKNNGFKEGRNLIHGKLKKDYGGGLCQLSGILYHLCLLSRLNIIERYNHSLDIYNEKSRFTPLGADATVVYGYKDLRFVNNFDFPISFDFKINNNSLIATLKSPELIKEQEVFFKKIEAKNSIKIITTNKEGEIMEESNYKKPTKDSDDVNEGSKNSITPILTNFFSGTFILVLLTYFLFTGLFDFIIYSFSQSILSFFMGLVLSILTLVFIAGSIINISEGFKRISLYKNNPQKEKTNLKQLYLSLSIGVLPLVFSFIFGMIDFYVYELNEVLLLPILTIVFSPFIFASKLNSSRINVFYGMLFWFILTSAGFYIFN